MYDAKEDGRDRIARLRASSDARSARMKGRVTWLERIRGALEEDRFTLLAQPIVELATGAASQYELLLRMTDETGDLIPPGSFLYIAERLGPGAGDRPLGRQERHRACSSEHERRRAIR